MHDLSLIATVAAAYTAAWVLGLFTQWLRLSPIVGYLLAGVLIGPYTPGFVGDVQIAQQLAEVGVILLMFGVGLHFHLKDLLAVKNVAIPGAIGQSLVATAGILLALTGYLFWDGSFTMTTHLLAWSSVFFFASAGASAAYLTVSEIFPLEIRALAIAFFYAFGTAIGGVFAPGLFGMLIDTGSRVSVAFGYLFGAALMLAAGLVAARYGVAAERKPLEAVARPLSAVE